MSTFIERIMGEPAGQVATIMPDYVVINDGISHAAVDEIKAVAEPGKVWVIYDHDVPTGSPLAADILRKNLTFAETYGCHYVQAKGIGYQYMFHEVVKPGEIVIGGGSHGSLFGAVGVLGINVSIPELARVTETGRYSMIVPETVSILIEGNLRTGISVMDAALHVLMDTPDLEGKAIEFYCPQLSKEEQAVLCSMACITGAFTAFITNEEPTAAISINLDHIEQMLMMPCEKRQSQKYAVICPKKELEGTVLQAGQIGGYTGGTIAELRKAASLIKDKTLALGFRLTVCPATSKDYIEAMEEGIITAFIDYGAQISAAGDHSVVTQGAGAMGPGENLITTGLYTYSGAMGCEDVLIYTASVESVIAASTTKTI